MNPDDSPASPMENANFVSKIFFCWLLPFFQVGSKRQLKLSDVYRLAPQNKSEKLGNDLAQAWRDQVRQVEKRNSINKADESKSPSFGKALVKVFFWQFTAFGIFTFVEECIIKISQPIFLGLIIRYCAGEFEDLYGYLFGAGLVISTALDTVPHQPFYFTVLQTGMKIRVACSSLIYRKSLKLSQAAIAKTNVGQLVNLLSNDVHRFDQSVTFIHFLWVGPIQLAVVTYILWGYYGWPCLVGVSVLLLYVPFQFLMGKLFGKLRLQVAIRTDRRVRIMNEIVNAVRIIKMYAWELPFAKLVGDARKEEVKCIRKTAFLKAVNLSFHDISAKVVTFLTLLTFVLTGNYLNAEKVFVTLSLYNTVRQTMTFSFPFAITALAEALVSVKRLENFLLMEERNTSSRPIDHLAGSKDGHTPSKSKGKGEIVMTNLSARWSGATNYDVNVNTLSDISLTVAKGQLAAVVGSVGSGKTSLLHVLLHELPSLSGALQINGKIAYTSQEPWIFSGSVRENILFGRDYDYDRYHRVINACALSKDMTLFPFQDQTLVGDKGASLSGGQKARINLARAVYADADIYLLDDPLSAVDAEVAKHIFEKCIMGFLKEKTKVLVTHQLQFLKPADNIILLNKGRIEARGSYDELLKTGIDFTKALHTEQQSAPKSLPTQSGNQEDTTRENDEKDFEASTNVEQIGRRASSSMVEMGIARKTSVIPEEFEGGADEPTLVKSYGGGGRNDSVKDSSAPLVGDRKPKSAYGTFSPGPDSEKSGETDALLPEQHEETRTNTDIGIKLYWTYISVGTSCLGLLLLLASNILAQLLFSGSDYWLEYWTQIEEKRAPITTVNSSTVEFTTTTTEKPLDFLGYIESSRNVQIYIYCGLVASVFLMSFVRASTFFNICLNSSIELHRQLFQGVMRAAMRFFEINPSGRILNRFAKDIGTIDETLPQTLFDVTEVSLQVIGVVTIISINNPFLMIPSLSLPFAFYFVRKFYLKTSKSVKHLESMARSPVFSHLSTSLHGLSTIRAMGVENQFEKQFDAHQDLHSASFVLFLAAARWLAIFVEYCCLLYIGVVTFTFLLMNDGDSGSAVGLSIASAMSLTGILQWGVRQSAEAENQMVSVERVKEYAEIEPEGELYSSPDKKPPSTWPSKGEITFKNFAMKYGNDSPVLKNINCVFKPQEKIGIVGRTGAGKSSLITALFRITEPHQGDIKIDGLSILQLGLHDLRKKISIIPQDPVLFNNTLRRNLDPFGDYQDDQLWNVLEQIYLADTAREAPAGLDTEVAEGGSNFSVGQRQLICLGRAILRKNKILVLDEATANVDHETDALIQKTIREKFATCTVLTIAHRLPTVIDSDRIMVLDAGEIKEFDEPYKLLCNEQSAFSQLVDTTGKATAANLFQIAKATHEKRNPTNV